MTPLRCSSSSSPASAARLFMQLSYARHDAAATVSTSSILDVLLPRSSSSLLLPPSSTTRSFHCGTGATRKRSHRPRPAFSPTSTRVAAAAVETKPSYSVRAASNGTNDVLLAARPIRRPHCMLFSTTAAVRKTEAIHNPQKDDDGNEMLLEITPRAANRLSKIMDQDKNPGLALRIQVESGGCHGFQYLMSLTTLPGLPPSSPAAAASPEQPVGSASPSLAEVAAEEVTPSTTTSNAPSAPELREDDTVFAFVKEEGEEGGSQAQTQTPTTTAPKIVLDGPSLQLLRGSKVDYTMELIGSQFKIVDNPHATSSCGCGTSFDIKDL